MRDILSDVDRWLDQGKAIALATVVQTWGSSPRGVGARMAFTAEGQITGSVSGGCVEAAVVEAAAPMFKGEAPRLLHFSVSDETAWGVGLTCGGSLDVFVSLLDGTMLVSFERALAALQPIAMITVIRGPDDLLGRVLWTRVDGAAHGSLGGPWDGPAAALATDGLHHGASGRFDLAEGIEVFRDVFLPPPNLTIVGGVHVAKALVPLGRTIGWRTVMIDPRKAWGNRERFPEVDQLLQVWPQEALEQAPLNASSALVTLTHDPKLDDAALLIALRSPAFYVGALGSAGSQEKRRKRLLMAGLTDRELARLHAPVGLRIGAQTPEEIALAIMGEIVSEYRSRQDSGRPARGAPMTPEQSATRVAS